MAIKTHSSIYICQMLVISFACVLLRKALYVKLCASLRDIQRYISSHPEWHKLLIKTYGNQSGDDPDMKTIVHTTGKGERICRLFGK